MDSLSQNLYFIQLFALHDLTLITCSFTSIISGIYLSVENKQLTYNHRKYKNYFEQGNVVYMQMISDWYNISFELGINSLFCVQSFKS